MNDRYITELDGEFYAVCYSVKRGNYVLGPFATVEEANRA